LNSFDKETNQIPVAYK